MSDYDNGFKRAQEMYDAQEPPENDLPDCYGEDWEQKCEENCPFSEECQLEMK